MDPNTFYADPANSIGYLTRMAFRAFSRAMEARTAAHGVTSGQWRFLRVLWRQDGISQRELSARVGLTEPTTVIALKSLERSGFVRRERSAQDRRRAHVWLTPAARALEERLMPAVAEVNALALNGLAEADIAVLRRALAHVTRNLTVAEAEAPASDSPS